MLLPMCLAPIQPLTRPVSRKMTSLKVGLGGFAAPSHAFLVYAQPLTQSQYQKPDCSKHIDDSKGSIRNFFGRKKVPATKKKNATKPEPHSKAKATKKIKVNRPNAKPRANSEPRPLTTTTNDEHLEPEVCWFQTRGGEQRQHQELFRSTESSLSQAGECS